MDRDKLIYSLMEQADPFSSGSQINLNQGGKWNVLHQSQDFNEQKDN